MLRKLRRSIAKYNLKMMGVEQVTKKKSKGKYVDTSKFGGLWRKYDHFIPNNSKRQSKITVRKAV